MSVSEANSSVVSSLTIAGAVYSCPGYDAMYTRGMQPKPIPADPDDLVGTYDAFDKLDGWRLLLSIGSAVVRNGRNIWRQLPASVRQLATDTPLDGELIATGQPASRVSSALASGEALEFRPFHIPTWTGDARTEHQRLTELGYDPPHYFGRFKGGRIAGKWNEWSQAVSEGVVLRPTGNGPWLKLKRTRSIDLSVIGLNAGKHGVGSLSCRLPNGKTVRVGGLDHDTQESIDAGDVGRIVEVVYQEETHTGSLRHPRFGRWRDDLAMENSSL